jgi:hypothetical protein
MTDGIFIEDDNGFTSRPKSKKAIKEAMAKDPASVIIENTSMHGGKGGRLTLAHFRGEQITFVGPDPYRDRRFYGTISVAAGDEFKATVK